MSAKEIAKYYHLGTLGSFSTSLMELFMKADTVNQIKLASVFPEYYDAYKLWFYKPEGWDDDENLY